jgi:hypothetical protein
MQIICDDPGRVWVQDMTNPSRPPGRPRHGIEGIKRSPLTLHITDTLKDELRYEAHASGRSLTQEVEYRARWSLSEHRLPERRVTELRLEMVLYEIGELVRAAWRPPAREDLMFFIEGIKRSPLTLHITEALKDALRHEAQASGRSLTQEVEYRLRWSLSEHRAWERPVTELRLEALLSEIGELVKENWWNPEIAAAAYRRELLIRPRKSKSPRNSRSRRP